ncbi:MAG: hypothetical protein WA152_03760 [Microgenomates group bacterium]
MWKEIEQIDDGRLHVATISPNNKVLTICKNYGLQFTEPCDGNVSGYVSINGRGHNRAVQNEDCIGFGNILETVLNDPLLEVIII